MRNLQYGFAALAEDGTRSTRETSIHIQIQIADTFASSERSRVFVK